MMPVEIPLTRGCVALVDDEDAERVLAHSWSVTHSHSGKTRYAGSRFGGRFVKMHHFIVGKAPKGLQVDHIDGNGFNNTRANLRIASAAENVRNGRKHRTHSGSPTSTPYKGVCAWRGRRFDARICDKARFPRGPFNIGSFSTPEDAAKAYDACARLLYGEFARVNFPREGEQCAHEASPVDPARDDAA